MSHPRDGKHVVVAFLVNPGGYCTICRSFDKDIDKLKNEMCREGGVKGAAVGRSGRDRPPACRGFHAGKLIAAGAAQACAVIINKAGIEFGCLGRGQRALLTKMANAVKGKIALGVDDPGRPMSARHRLSGLPQAIDAGQISDHRANEQCCRS